MSGLKLHHVVFFVSLALLASSIPSRAEPFEKWTVHIVNGLGGGRTLFAHCKSKDNDIGLRNLTDGTEFNWSFKNNFGGTTLFYCYLRTDHKQYASFDVFWIEKHHDWLGLRCHNKDCIWTAKNDGVYIRNLSTKQDEFIHPWGTHW